MRRRQSRALFERYSPESRFWGKKNKNMTPRYIGIAAVFLIICLFYTIRLIGIQIDGSRKFVDDTDTFTRTYSVAGLRGEIYDRNGVLLVGNELKYNIVIEYGAIPDTTHEFNRAILASLDAISKTGCEENLAEDLYVLVGAYPNYSYVSELQNKASDEYRYFTKIIDSNKLDPNISATDFAKAICRKYKLYEDLYTNEEITKLLRVRYELERVNFGYYQSYTLATDVPMELISYVEEAGIEGVNFKIEASRYYTYPGYASHILGRVGKIQAEKLDYYTDLGYTMDALVGTSGCEEAFESYLRSSDGILTIEYDSDRNVVRKYYEEEPISGNDVWLTIDIELQIAAENALKASVDSLAKADGGAAVALDPSSGAVLAIASYPTFDITRISDPTYYKSIQANENLPEFNRALSGVYAPGSVYKVGVALAALEEGAITSSTRYTCNRVFPHLHNPTCLGNHGSYSVTEAIRDSCNVFFYYLGMNMGTDSLTKYTAPLGLGRPTGIELPERAGTVAGAANASEAWNAGNDLSAAIGQANHGYTPLQLGVYISTIANGGYRYSTHLLHSVHEFYTGNTIYEYQRNVLEATPISASTRATLFEAMRQVVESHTNIKRNFSSLPVTVGGKTGTAEVNGKTDYALFAGIAPYNAPEIAAVCIIEEGAMGENASRTVSEIFKAYYRQKEKAE